MGIYGASLEPFLGIGFVIDRTGGRRLNLLLSEGNSAAPSAQSLALGPGVPMFSLRLRFTFDKSTDGRENKFPKMVGLQSSLIRS